MNKGLISVVIPVYNVEQYLPKTLDCILEQTYTNWELILVDDGSTDGSVEVAKTYCEKDRRVLFVQRESLPKGAPHCRNIGLSLAKGDYVIYLDSDDIIAPYCFQQRIDFIEANECDFAVFPLMGFYNKLFDAHGMIFGYKPEGDSVVALLRRTLPFVVVSNIYKRKRLVESGVTWDMDLKSYQDSDYNLQVIRAGLSYKISNLLPDYFYRLSVTNSICKKLYTVSNCQSQIGFLQKQTAIYGTNKVYHKALLICAAQIFQNILASEDKEKMVLDFVRIDLFKNHALLRNSLKLIANISGNSKNEVILSMLQLVFIPLFFIRFKLCFRKSDKRNRIMYNTLAVLFKDSVTAIQKEQIASKI
jgi:glycosyltransferase involved in cell wall biosynthesis